MQDVRAILLILSFPVNMFPDPSESGKFSPSWLYSALAGLYEKWLPGEGQQVTLREAAYFSVSGKLHAQVNQLSFLVKFRDICLSRS